MEIKSIFIFALLLSIGLLANVCCLNPSYIYGNINISRMWKEDTCGINGYRLQITPVILRHYKEIVGCSSKKIIKVFGQPDFVQELNLWLPNTTLLIYSTSSIEKIGPKCGDPVVRSFGFFIDIKTNKVIDIKEFTS